MERQSKNKKQKIPNLKFLFGTQPTSLALLGNRKVFEFLTPFDLAWTGEHRSKRTLETPTSTFSQTQKIPCCFKKQKYMAARACRSRGAALDTTRSVLQPESVFIEICVCFVSSSDLAITSGWKAKIS